VPPPAFAFASHGACSAALRAGSAALPPHRVAHFAVHHALHIRIHRIARQDRNVQPAPPSMPELIRTPVLSMMLPVTMASLHPLPTTTLPVVMQPMVPKMVNGVPNASVSLGASLRDRATLPSPLRGLGPAGIASARPGGTSCVAGDGFAVHRAPHYAVQWCPHQCGALHLRLRPHRPPLNRRGGFDLPVSPASISRTLMPQIWPPRPPGAALGVTPHAPRALSRQARA